MRSSSDRNLAAAVTHGTPRCPVTGSWLERILVLVVCSIVAAFGCDAAKGDSLTPVDHQIADSLHEPFGTGRDAVGSAETENLNSGDGPAAAVEPVVAAAVSESDRVAELESGDPIAEGRYVLHLSPCPDSVISFQSTSARDIRGYVMLDGDESYGTVHVNTPAGSATGSVRVPTANMRTGNSLLDDHMIGPNWLHAFRYRYIELTALECIRKSPTVWKIDGLLVVKDVQQPVSTYANVRLAARAKDHPTQPVRIQMSFLADLRSFGFKAEEPGALGVSRLWRIDVCVFAIPAK